MADYLSAIWKCRYFWLSLVKMDLRTRYRRSVLGLGWSLLNPIAMTIILCTVFSKIFNMNIYEFGPFILAGLASWNFLVQVTLQGCQCFFQGEQYIRQYPAPMAIYPLRTALGTSVHFLLALGVVIVAKWVFTGFPGVPALLSLIPTLGMLFLLGWSLAILAGVCNIYFQDTQHLLEVGFQILFYATPIIYKVETLRDNGLGWLMWVNPAVPFLHLVREPILQGQVPTLAAFATAGLIVAVTAGLATFALSVLQRRIIFQL